MEHGEFKALMEQAIASRAVVTVFAQCEITYSGRAEAFLPRGDRLIILKADGALLVHQPEGGMPINYMKAGAAITLDPLGEGTLLRAFHSGEKSYLDITLHLVHDALARKLEDGQRQDLAGNERDMSDWIRDNPTCIGKDFRPISREEQTDVGFIDVFGHDGAGRIVVVECKRVTASLNAVDQLRRYVERVKRIKGTENVTGVLAAPAITPNALEMLTTWGYRFCVVTAPKRLERWNKQQKSLGEF